LKVLTVRNLSVSYFSHDKSLPALRNISFNLKRGECIAVVGESGCGKSTLALALMDLIEPSEGIIRKGRILFHDKEKELDFLKENDEYKRSLRGSFISLILQDPYNTFNPVIKIGRQLIEAFAAHDKSYEQARAKALKCISEVHLKNPEEILNSYPHELSGGMLQRASIAAALINNPKVLIADEPTSNLDVTTQMKIIENLKALKKEHELSMIFISHNLNLVSGFADMLCILYLGEIVEIGPAERVFKNPLHPYTAGLIKALPRLSKGAEVSPIPGSVPSLNNIPDGCSFADRCSVCKSECKFKTELVQKEPGHYVRCMQ